MSTATTHVIKIAIIGLGEIAETHLRVLELFPFVELTAGVDVRADRTITFRWQPVPVYQAITDLAAQQLDMVIAATPTPVHYQTCQEFIATLHAPLRILVEKPVADTINHVEELLQLSRPGLSLEPMLHFAYSPEVLWAAEHLPEWIRLYGSIVHYDAYFADPRSGPESASKRQALGTSWLDLGINALSVAERLIEVAGAEKTQLSHTEMVGELAFRHQHMTGNIKTDWRVQRSSYDTVLEFASGAKLSIDHFNVKGRLEVSGKEPEEFAYLLHPRRFSHYLYLYQDLLGDYKLKIPSVRVLALHRLLFG